MKYKLPDDNGKFGIFGGRYVPETLVSALDELKIAFEKMKKDRDFNNEFNYYLKHYVGRPSALYNAKQLGEKYGCKIYLKREDLNHTGAHKINNALGQCLLAMKLRKKRIIAETGAGQHGVATATACALLKMECEVYMGKEDARRQELNLFRMELLGAKVNIVESGTNTLKDALNEAMRDWVANVKNTHYVIGSVAGPEPFPELVRHFQKVIGQETKLQILAYEKRLPTHLIACVGGGSNAIGFFYPFMDDKQIKMIGVEAGGIGLDSDKHCATLTKGKVGVFHGSKSYLLYDDDGQVLPVHSISAGLDYPGVGPEHSYLKDAKRVEYAAVTDDEAVDALMELSKLEGIIPALESAHAVAYLPKLKENLSENDLVIINISGRGDKDMAEIQRYQTSKGQL